jgi:hypothetical protein
MCEDRIAWLIGFIDGLIIGTFYSCSEYVDDDEVNTNALNELVKGAKVGFKDGTWIGHLDK